MLCISLALVVLYENALPHCLAGYVTHGSQSCPLARDFRSTMQPALAPSRWFEILCKPQSDDGRTPVVLTVLSFRGFIIRRG
jgi:hypothetical protein